MRNRQSVLARIQTFEKSSTSPNDATVFYVSPTVSKSLGNLTILEEEQEHLSLDGISPPPMSGDDEEDDDDEEEDDFDNDDKRMRTNNALQNRLDALRKKYDNGLRTWQSQEMELKRLHAECQILQEQEHERNLKDSNGNGNDDLEINEHLRQHVHELQQALGQERRQNQEVKEELHLYQTTKVEEHEITIQDKDSMIQGLEHALQMANDALAKKQHAHKAKIADLKEQEMQVIRSSKEALQMVHATLKTKDADISLLQAKLDAARDAMLVQTNTIAELQDKLETKETSSITSTSTLQAKLDAAQDAMLVQTDTIAELQQKLETKQAKLDAAKDAMLVQTKTFAELQHKKETKKAKSDAAKDAMLVQTNTTAELQEKLETKETSSSTAKKEKKKKKDSSKSKTTSKK
jgi:hypothetical protein